MHASDTMRVRSTFMVAAELTGQVQRAKQEHLDRQDRLLDPTQKQQLLTERTRVEENVRRLQQARRSEGSASAKPCQTCPPTHPPMPTGSWRLACAQETDGLRENIKAAECRAVEISANEQQIRQQENVEVPRSR